MIRKILWIVLMMMLSFLLVPFAVSALQSHEAYYLFLGDYPTQVELNWTHEANGIAHDRDHWFIAQDLALWKIPVTCDLDAEVSPGRPCHAGAPPVLRIRMSQVPELAGYTHFGDPEWFEFDGRGYLFVPLEGRISPGVAVFRGDTLQYIHHALFPEHLQRYGSWCALDPQGFLYSEAAPTNTAITKYGIDWTTLRDQNRLILQGGTHITLLNDRGAPVEILNQQGGAISPSGELFYLVAGDETDLHDSHGLHVFDLATRRLVQRSSRTQEPFVFGWIPGLPECEEPEGLTIWDLDDGRAPGIRGQLHVLLLDNDPFHDEVYLKHYANTIYVDRTYTGTEAGTVWRPFRTLATAYNFSWDGARIRIRGGSYPETLTLSKRVMVEAYGGTATVGP